jgi:hypothetical protein
VKVPGDVVTWQNLVAIVVDNQSHKLHKEHHQRGPNLTLIAVSGSGELVWVFDSELKEEP